MNNPFVKLAFGGPMQYNPKPRGYYQGGAKAIGDLVAPGSFLDEYSKSTDNAVRNFNTGVTQTLGGPMDILAWGGNKLTGGYIPRDVFGGSKSIQRGLTNIFGENALAQGPAQDFWSGVARGSGNVAGMINPFTAAATARGVTNTADFTGRQVGHLSDAAFNPASFMNPAKYSGNWFGSRWAQAAANKLPGFLQNWGARASFAPARDAFNASLSGGVKNFLANRAAVTASSVLGPANIASYKYLDRPQTIDIESQFDNPMGPVASRATTLASMSPFLLSRGGALPYLFLEGLHNPSNPDAEPLFGFGGLRSLAKAEHAKSNLAQQFPDAPDPYQGNYIHRLIADQFKSQPVPTRAPSELGGQPIYDIWEALQNYRSGPTGRYYAPGFLDLEDPQYPNLKTTQNPQTDTRYIYDRL